MSRKIEYSNTLEKKLRKYKGNHPVIEGFKKKAKELEKFQDPSKYGKLLHGSWKGFQEEHITSAVIFIFRWLPEHNLIQFIDLDDHKNLYGRDNKA